MSPCLLVIFLLAKEPEPEKLLQQGRLAQARGEYERAVMLYEQAEIHSTNPAEVAFYLAGAKYHLAMKTEGVSAELLEAEQLYRCCLEPSDPLRPRALCGLGNCLLHKAGTRDESSLRAALACYDQCLRSAGTDEELASDARYNREIARLFLLQFQPPPPDAPGDRPPHDDLHPHWPRPDDRQAMPMPAGPSGGDGSVDPHDGAGGESKQDQGKDTTRSNEPPQPGKGNLPPIPDELDVPPLSPHVAAEHLELAAKKVLRERQTHHRRGEESSAKGVKDW